MKDFVSWKKFFATILILFLPISSIAFDGKIYVGRFLDSNKEATPDGKKSNYLSGVEIGHKLWFVRPRVKIETSMDEYLGNLNYHPIGVKYDIGAEISLPEGIYIDITHVCNHPIDMFGPVEQYNLITIGIFFGENNQ